MTLLIKWSGLWDLPTDFDRWIGHASYHHQICFEDPTDLKRRCICEQWTCSVWHRRSNIFVKSYHWWWELGLPRDKATIFRIQTSNLTKIEKGEDGQEQHEVHVHNSLTSRRFCTKNVWKGKTLNSTYYWHFPAQWLSENVQRRHSELSGELAVIFWQYTISRFLVSLQVFFYIRNDCISYIHYISLI